MVFHPYLRRLKSLTVDVITKAELSSLLSKNPEHWMDQVMNPRPPTQQTGAFSTDGLYFMSDLTECPEPHPVLICVYFCGRGRGRVFLILGHTA